MLHVKRCSILFSGFGEEDFIPYLLKQQYSLNIGPHPLAAISVGRRETQKKEEKCRALFIINQRRDTIQTYCRLTDLAELQFFHNKPSSAQCNTMATATWLKLRMRLHIDTSYSSLVLCMSKYRICRSQALETYQKAAKLSIQTHCGFELYREAGPHAQTALHICPYDKSTEQFGTKFSLLAGLPVQIFAVDPSCMYKIDLNKLL